MTKDSAQAALYDLIEKSAKSLVSATINEPARALAAANLAAAYRYTSGGPQPGGAGLKD